MNKGIIFNIQRFSISDGPGIRTNIFLKGCMMACRWCSNPEGQSSFIETARYPEKCLGPAICGRCRYEDGSMRPVDEQVKRCPSGAISVFGEELTDDELMVRILRDQDYYRENSGGVTLTGGEPLMQPDFARSVLMKCHDHGIHTCVETAMYVPGSDLMKVLPYTDLVIADIKLMDPKAHRKWTGVGNELILRNIKTAVSTTDVMLRIPMIPGVNDSRENAEKTADYILNELGNRITGLQLLPFMRLGEDKYHALGREYPMGTFDYEKERFEKDLEEICDYYNDRNITCTIEGRKRDKE